MILGYGIYERVHIETGMRYAGKVWWAKSGMTVERACIRRWKREEKDGIQGLHDGFESRILYSEMRQDTPEMSDKMYHIRITVDEHHAVESIPLNKRLNKIDPLSQLNFAASEEVARLGGRIGGRKCAENKVGVCGQTLEKRIQNGHIAVESGQLANVCAKGGRIQGPIQGRKNVENGHLASIRTPENLAKGGRISGRKAVESGQLANLRTSEHQSKAGRIGGKIGGYIGTHNRWHVRQNIINPNCSLCIKSTEKLSADF